MAKVNWFPGHMKKALNEMTDEVKNVDMIIYVLDSRAPFSCLNPEYANLSNDKPILYVLNKADLGDEKIITLFKEEILKKQNSVCISLNSIMNGANKIIEPIMKKLCSKKLEKYKNKGINVHLRAMVLGVPNSGKSTLINNMCGVKKAKTGDRAGVTRGKQWLTLSNGFELLDTPGTLWPNLENQEVAKNLAIIGSIKNDILDMNDLCFELIKFLQRYYPKSLKEKYDIDVSDKETLTILDEIAGKKHYLLKGNEIDYDRTCFAIIDDFRKGKLGKISLDR